MRRDFDGVYFRIMTSAGYENVCFSDLNDTQMREIMERRSEEWLKSLCEEFVSEIGERLDIVESNDES